MILQRLISETAQIPDLSEPVVKAKSELNSVKDIREFKDVEILNSLIIRNYSCENMRRRKVNLKQIETALLKAKHAVMDDEEDFV
jgi:hypothetical protein